MSEHVPKSAQYQLNKFGRLNPKNIRDGEKIILKLLFLSLQQVLIKNEGATQKKWANMSYFLFCLHWLAEHTPKKNKNC